MSKVISYSEKLECLHCHNVAPMRVVGSVGDTVEQDMDNGPPVQHGIVYEVLSCPKCEQATIRSGRWNDSMESDDWRGTVIYPSQRPQILGLPPAVEQEFRAAEMVSQVSPNAYAVLLGRVLDVVCQDRNAVGDTLHKQLIDLAAKQEIPRNLADLAHKLRQLRNVGAHASLGTLSADEVPVLEALCRAVLEYVYAAPKLMERVGQLVAKLKA